MALVNLSTDIHKMLGDLPSADDVDLLSSSVVRAMGKTLKAPFSLSTLPGGAASVLVVRWAQYLFSLAGMNRL